MIKSLASGWLTHAFFAVLLSPWTLCALVSWSWFFCSVSGWQAFIVWGLSFTGVLLLALGIALDNRLSHLRIQGKHPGRRAVVWSGLVWLAGWVCLSCCPLIITSPVHLIFFPVGSVCAGLLCLQVRDRGGLAWIR
ncbi:TPA: hypothetical protein NV424_001869 [Citrobacter freundii]|nr:hypothetical protein [Citrobacter freundii]HCJ7758081.1 hypothetical protein [Citrobacter freundii]HEI8930995.1 hypothetical protein [Citrobacter freundii]